MLKIIFTYFINVNLIYEYQFMKHLCLAFYVLLLSTNNSYCQTKAGNIWYFGLNAGIDFNSGWPVAKTDGILNTNEGCASICSKTTGQLLFYTDGVHVYNRNHAQMPTNISNLLLGGSSSTQSSVIVPHPGDTNKYFIFTSPPLADGFTTSTVSMCYTMVDLTLNSSLGDITDINTPLFDTSCEKIAAIGNCDGSEYWVVGRKWNSDLYYAYKITSSGINTIPIISQVGIVHSDFSNTNLQFASVGYMKFSPNGKKLGLVAYAYINACEVFDFNFNTGILSNPFLCYLPTTGTFLDSPYGCTFSPSSNKFYVSTIGTSTNGIIWQFNANASSNSAFVASKQSLISSSFTEFGAMQIGPDSSIYVVKNGSPFLSTITNADSVVPIATFNNDVIPLASGVGKFGLPNIVENFLLGNNEKFKLIKNPICIGDTAIATLFKDTNLVILPNTNITYSKDSLSLYLYPKSSTTYTVIAKDFCNKPDTNYYSVFVEPSPIVSFIANPTMPTLANSTFTLTNITPNTYTLSWHYNNEVVSNNTNYIHNITGVANYCFSLEITTPLGCTNKDSACVYVADTLITNIYVPNTFTPNDDGINDKLQALGKHFTLQQFNIYNRYGELLFTTNNILMGWDGSYQKANCEGGVYFYVLKYLNEKNEPLILKGDVLLVR
jgi:gliding motility-associated-like protein